MFVSSLLGKLVGRDNLPQVLDNLAAWESNLGLEPTPPATWTSSASPALAHLDALGVAAHILAWHDDSSRFVCIFAFNDALYLTRPGAEGEVGCFALDFVVQQDKSALT